MIHRTTTWTPNQNQSDNKVTQINCKKTQNDNRETHISKNNMQNKIQNDNKVTQDKSCVLTQDNNKKRLIEDTNKMHNDENWPKVTTERHKAVVRKRKIIRNDNKVTQNNYIQTTKRPDDKKCTKYTK